MSNQNFKGKRKGLVAGVVTLALGGAAIVAPHTAVAETKNNLNQPLACNLQLKNPGGIPLGQASAVEGVYNSGNPTYNNFQIKLASTTAPDTVAQGEEFDYVIDAGTLQIPGVIKAAVTANVSKVSQLNLWYQLPDNAEVVSIKQEGGAAGVKVVQEGNRLRVWIPEPEQGSKDVTKWTKTSKGDYVHGGASATKDGQVFNYPMPKVTIRLKATGKPGSTIQAGFPKVDAAGFGSDLPIQFYADASARAPFVGNISANGFIRCGLSEDDTYWPKASRNNKTLPSEQFSAVTIEAKKTQAETNDPKAKGPVNITEGDKLPNAQDQIADFAKLPAGTKAAWKTTHDKAGDNQAGEITVTYPDGTTDTVKITVNVKKKATQAETNDPKAKGAVTITEGDALPTAQDQIADFASLPAGTTAAWKTTHDKVGDNQNGEITVTYPDGTTDTVKITVNVEKKATQADANDPKAKAPVTITQGDQLPKAEDQIADFASLPAGTKAEWASKHESVGDNQNGAITVTYPDGSTDTVNLPVNVKAQWAPKGKTNPTSVEVGTEVADADAKSQITNADSAPQGTTFTWKTKPDTTAAAENVPAVVTVTVPGKDPVDVEVKYNVTAEPVTWEPEVDENTKTVDLNAPITEEDAKAWITNADEAPADATYEWAKQPDTSTPGEKTGTVKVTADGKTYERTVKYNVVAAYAPQAKDEPTEVQVGTEVSDADAKAQIANAADAPFGTKFEWAQKPGTSKVGETTGKVKVTVEGKEPVEVEVKYNVVSDFVPEAKDEPTEVDQDATVADDAKSQIANADKAPAGTTFEWKTKPDTSKPGEATGVVTVTVPGGEPKDVEVKYTVKEKKADPQPGEDFTPKAKETPTEVEQDADIKDEDAKAQIADADKAPENTTFTWKTKPDTSKPGEVTGVVTVTVPGKDPQDIEVKYTVKEKKTDTPTDPTDPTDPQPGEPTEKKVVVKAKGAKEGDQVTVNVAGVDKTFTAGPNGEIEIKDGDLPAGVNKFQVTVRDGSDGSSSIDSKWNVDLEKGTARPALSGLGIAGIVFAVAAVALSFIPIPGLKEGIANIQRQMGFFNPQLATQVQQAQPIIGGLAGIAIIGTILGLSLKSKVTVEDNK